MNPNWIVVRPHKTGITPTTRGAVAVASHGWYLTRQDGLYVLTTSQPDNCEVTVICQPIHLTREVLRQLHAASLPKRATGRQVVVWVHGLADLVTDLFQGYARAFACSTEPTITSQPNKSTDVQPNNLTTVQYDGYHEAEGRVQIVKAELDLDAPRVAGHGLPAFRLSLLRGPVGAATITFAGRRAVRVLDSQAYIRAELRSRDVRGLLAHATGAPLTGERGIGPAEATRVLGERIADVWTLLDVAPAPTPAATGARVFRRHFLPKQLTRPPYAVESAAEMSFHGGKIGLWVEKGSKVRVHVYDMRAAYGWALTRIPAFLSGEWTPIRGLPPDDKVDGFARITGKVLPCKWPVIASHDGRWLRGEAVYRTWVTLYELREAIASKEVELDECVSWVWQETGAGGSPWASFGAEVFRRRDLCTDALRSVYKLALVGLYGKTVQRSAVPPFPPDGDAYEHGVPVVYCNRGAPDERRARYFRAGGLYYPVVGSLVTGMVRAAVHRVEHEYGAVHTAVDAVHVTTPLGDELVKPGLGGWRHVGAGYGTYHGPNNYAVVGARGWRKQAAAGVARRAGTDDREVAAW